MRRWATSFSVRGWSWHWQFPSGRALHGGASKVKALGEGPAYDQVGKLAVMHAGRIKPLDTVAREEVKHVFGRETIKLHDAAGNVVETWGPVARVLRLDGPARVLGRPALHPGRLPSLPADDPRRLDQDSPEGRWRPSHRPPPPTVPS